MNELRNSLIQKNRVVANMCKELDPQKEVKKQKHLQQVQYKMEKKKKDIQMVLCVECKNEFGSTTGNIRQIYCPKCYETHVNDLMVYIDAENVVTFSGSQEKEAENFLSSLQSDIRLDLHGVLDLLSLTDGITNLSPVCVISFVGKNTETRQSAFEEVTGRVKSGQVKFGILLFKRGKRNKENYLTFHEPGSKAWTNSFIPISDKGGIFIDDSEDHVLSVQSFNIPNLEVFRMAKNDDEGVSTLQNKITKFVERYQ